MTSITVPLDQLYLSDRSNARTRAPGDVDQLARSIVAKGLVEDLIIRPREEGGFEVTDGGRRLRAVRKLIEENALPSALADGLPCKLREEDVAAALETSLIVSTGREPLHPVEEYEAFARLADEHGYGVEEIAAHFGINDRDVKARLALGRLSPFVREHWLKGRINAELAMAFACNPDHGAQEKLLKRAEKDRYLIQSTWTVRRELLPKAVPVRDARVGFVTIAAYEAEGGKLSNDLFGDQMVLNPELLDALVHKKLATTAAAIAEKGGWSWNSAAQDLPQEWIGWKRAARPEPVYTAEQKKRLKAVESAISALEKLFEKREEAPTDEEEAECDKLEAEKTAIEEAGFEAGYGADVRARSGVVVSWNHDAPAIYYGVVQGKTHKGEAAASADDSAPAPKGKAKPNAKAKPGAAPEPATLSQALVADLGRQLTRGVATAVAQHPRVALALTIAACAQQDQPCSLNISMRDGARVGLLGDEDSKEHRWLVDEKPLRLFERLVKETPDQQAQLLAVAIGDGLRFRAEELTHKDAQPIVDAMRADVLRAEIVKAFKAADYFERAPKTAALAAIADCLGAHEAAKHKGKPKGDLATYAAQLATEKHWLPKELRFKDCPATRPSEDAPRAASAPAAKPSARKAVGRVAVSTKAKKKAPAKKKARR